MVCTRPWKNGNISPTFLVFSKAIRFPIPNIHVAFQNNITILKLGKCLLSPYSKEHTMRCHRSSDNSLWNIATSDRFGCYKHLTRKEFAVLEHSHRPN